MLRVRGNLIGPSVGYILSDRIATDHGILNITSFRRQAHRYFSRKWSLYRVVHGYLSCIVHSKWDRNPDASHHRAGTRGWSFGIKPRSCAQVGRWGVRSQFEYTVVNNRDTIRYQLNGGKRERRCCIDIKAVQIRRYWGDTYQSYLRLIGLGIYGLV